MPRHSSKAGYRRQPVTGAIPDAVPWVLITVVASAAVVAFSAVTAPARVESGALPEQVETRIATVGYDKSRRSLPFTVYVLTDQLSWKLESTDDLEGGHTILNPELNVAINLARDVFCVGTASFEGATQTEEARAAQRARKLEQWVGAVIKNPSYTRLFTLNAGQYQGPKELLSSIQRKAIILVTGPHEEGVNLSEGLASGLEREQQKFPVVYSLLHSYSRSNQWLKMP